jgi:hypothetical protein
MYPSSVMSKISNTLPHLDGSLPDHANSDLSFQSHITSMTIEQKEITEDISHAIPHDIPMTSMDLWDIPVTLPSIDSSSSIKIPLLFGPFQGQKVMEMATCQQADAPHLVLQSLLGK